MDTVNETSIKVLEHLDFETVCDARLDWGDGRDVVDPMCGSPARWASTCAKCAVIVLMCWKHHDALMTCRTATCTRCGLHGPVSAVLDIRAI